MLLEMIDFRLYVMEMDITWISIRNFLLRWTFFQNSYAFVFLNFA